MKSLQCVDTDIAMDVSRYNGHRNIWKSDLGGTTYYWVADIVSDEFKIYRFSTSWGSKTQEGNQAKTAGYTINASMYPSIKKFSATTFYAAFAEYDGTHSKVWIATSADHGDTWAWTSFIVSNKLVLHFDFFKISTTVYLAMGATNGGAPPTIYLIMTDLVDTFEDIDTLAANNGYAAGYVDSDNYYYFLAHDGTDILIRKYEPVGHTFATSETTTFEDADLQAGSWDLDIATQGMWKQDGTIIVYYSNGLYYKDSYTSSWSKNLYAGYSFLNNIKPSWFTDNNDYDLKIKYLWGYNNIFKVFEGGSVVKINVPTGDQSYVTFGWNDWGLGISKNIFQLQKTTITNIAECLISTSYESYPIAQFKTNTSVSNDQYLIFYDDSDNEIIEGYVKEPVFDGDYYTAKLISPWQIDWDRPITMQYQGKQIHEILADIIDNFMYFIHYDAGLDTTSSDTYTITFDGVPFSEICKWADRIGGAMSYIMPDGEFRWTEIANLTASGLSLSDSDLLDVPNIKAETVPFSLIVGYGSYINGAPLEAIYQSTTLGYGTIFFHFPNINSQTALQAAVDELGTQLDNNLTKYDFPVSNQGLIQVGYKVTLASTNYGITSATVYCFACDYDPLNLSTYPIFYSRVYFNTDKKKDEQYTGQKNRQFAQQTLEGINEHAHIICNSADNYKKPAGVLGKDWVVGNWTDAGKLTSANGSAVIVSSYKNHNVVFKMGKDVGANPYLNYTHTSAVAEITWDLWFLITTTTTSQGYLTPRDSAGTYCASFSFIAGVIGSYNGAGTDTIGAYEADTWYHIRLVYDGATTKFYLNGTLICTRAILNAEATIDRLNITLENGGDGYVYVDALACSLDGYTAWDNLGDGHVRAVSMALKSGLSGELHPYNGSLHMITMRDDADDWWWGHAHTDGHYFTINFITGAISLAGGATQDGADATPPLVPIGTKAVLIQINCASSVIGTYNRFIAAKDANGVCPALVAWSGSVANYSTLNMGIVELGVNGLVRFTFGITNPIVYGSVGLMGYFI